MQVLFDFSIRLFLTQAEFKLIGKALMSNLKGKEIEDAQELNYKLLEAKVNEHETHISFAKQIISSKQKDS